MIHHTVRFTGVTLPTGMLSTRLGNRRTLGPIPASWARVIVDDAPNDGASRDRLERWVNETMQGRWGTYDIQSKSDSFAALGRIVIAFENDDDALMFKLMDGGAIWKETQDKKGWY